jgi:glycosyltransferase involved in cell wall biosynthesis
VQIPRKPIASIVVPAHNEEAVIAANLRRLLDGTGPGEFDVIVVPNGCSDATAELARTVDGVRVVESPRPGKVNALHIGDSACRTFPRIYLDADVELTANSVRALVAAAERPGVLACAPAMRLDLTGVRWLARRTHTVHDRLVAPHRALAGVGVYVLTGPGHDRVFPIPDILSDDGWVHGSFQPHERVVVTEAESVVRPARTVSAYLKRRIRVRAGNRQLAAAGRAAPEGRLGLGHLVRLVRRREVSPLDAGCYLSVLVVDRTMSRLRRGPAVWGSDASSRATTPSQPA